MTSPPTTEDTWTEAPVREKAMVTKLVRGVETDVEGEILTAGLAITPQPEGRFTDRFAITHIPSGRSAMHGLCVRHVEDAAALLLMANVDWTAPSEELVKQDGVRELITSTTKAVGLCRGSCSHQPTWRVRCNTCDWDYDPEFDDGPLDARGAKEFAYDHRCEPDVEIAAPEGDRWMRDYEVNDDGTVRDER